MKLSFPIQQSFLDYPNNFSLALCIYVYGCCHNCKECHSSFLQNATHGKKVSCDELYDIVVPIANKNKTNKIVFMGGDPYFGTNIDDVNLFVEKYGEEYDICIYTGYELKELIDKNISNKFKFLKCGKFDKKLYQMPYKDDNKIVFASKNQVLYNSQFKEISSNGVYYFK